MTIGLPRRRNFFGGLDWSAIPRRRKTPSADSVGPCSFDEQTFHGGGLNAIRDHHRLRSDFNSLPATGDSFSTMALTFYKLSFDYTLQSE